MKKLAIAVTALAVALMMISQVNTVLAYATRTFDNFAGVTDAKAMKDLWVVSSSAWNAKIRSYTTNPVYDIGTIGWTWWTVRELCDGNIIDQSQYGGHAEYGDSDAWDISFQALDDCGGTHQGAVLGTHDFKHGGSEWRPYFDTQESLP